MRAPCKVSMYAFSWALFFPRFQAQRHQVKNPPCKAETNTRYHPKASGDHPQAFGNTRQSGLRWASSSGKISRNIRKVPHRATTPSKSIVLNTIVPYPTSLWGPLPRASAGVCRVRGSHFFATILRCRRHTRSRPQALCRTSLSWSCADVLLCTISVGHAGLRAGRGRPVVWHIWGAVCAQRMHVQAQPPPETRAGGERGGVA